MEIKRHILDLLKRIGLTGTEAKFYLTVYQNPQKTIAEIQKAGGFSHTSAYRSFERLKGLKLLTSSPDNWRKNIEAISLRAISEKLGRESLKLRKAQYELRSIENLMKLTNYQETPEPIEIFSDQNQITEECYKLLNADWNHISCYGSGERSYEIPGEKAMTDFVTWRARKGKTINAVFTELGTHTKELLKKNEQELRNGKLYIDPHSQNFMTYVYDKQVTIWQKDEELGKRAIIIHDPGLIKMYRTNFEKIWTAV